MEVRGPRASVETAGEVCPQTKISVLLSLRLRKFVPIHALMSARQSNNRCVQPAHQPKGGDTAGHRWRSSVVVV